MPDYSRVSDKDLALFARSIESKIALQTGAIADLNRAKEEELQSADQIRNSKNARLSSVKSITLKSRFGSWLGQASVANKQKKHLLQAVSNLKGAIINRYSKPIQTATTTLQQLQREFSAIQAESIKRVEMKHMFDTNNYETFRKTNRGLDRVFTYLKTFKIKNVLLFQYYPANRNTLTGSYFKALQTMGDTIIEGRDYYMTDWEQLATDVEKAYATFERLQKAREADAILSKLLPRYEQIGYQLVRSKPKEESCEYGVGQVYCTVIRPAVEGKLYYPLERVQEELPFGKGWRKESTTVTHTPNAQDLYYNRTATATTETVTAWRRSLPPGFPDKILEKDYGTLGERINELERIYATLPANSTPLPIPVRGGRKRKSSKRASKASRRKVSTRRRQ